jgi:FtsP/CotA-like multicopper oxidase with cupredoxin domain
MNRRDFFKYGSAGLTGLGAARLVGGAQMPDMHSAAPDPNAPPADISLTIAPVVVQLDPNRALSTIGYNGCSPGPVLRLKEGKPVTVEVTNETDVPELVHWHGLFIPPEVDGSEEEGTPMVPPRGRRRYQFTPRPAGTRWYHTHTMAGMDLHRSTYTGQFGFVIVEGANNPGHYDQEVFLALREWEPYLSQEDMDEMEMGAPGPQPEKPAKPDTRPNGYEIGYRIFSINDKSLGGGDPIKVKEGERLLVHVLNASATNNRSIAFAGHLFHVVALDGNPVATPRSVQVLTLGPGERVDAFVDMKRPGVWILGATSDGDRNDGMGIIVEYANQHGDPQWTPPDAIFWDYTAFGQPPASPPTPDQTIEMVIEMTPGGPGKFNQWFLNGKQYPHEREFVLKEGARHRMVFHNRSDDAHPLHMHRHNFELVEINGKRTSGVIKDTVIIPNYGRVTVDLVANQPGLTLFHCHNQIHMDFGFKALFSYG